MAAMMVVSLGGEHPMPFTLLGQDTPAARLTAGQAASTARAWLDALKRRDTAALAEKTQFPFTYKTTSRKKLCEGRAVDAKKLAATVDCLALRDKLLLEQLGYAEHLEVKVLEPAQIPPWVAKLAGKPTGRDWLVSAFLNGDGITFEFVLVVVPGGSGLGVVKTFLVNAEIELGSNEQNWQKVVENPFSNEVPAPFSVSTIAPAPNERQAQRI